MTITKTAKVNPFPAWSVDNQLDDKHEHRYSCIPTPEILRTSTLFGLPLRSFFTGEAVSNETLQLYIDQAISEIEHTLDLYITPVKFHERHDYDREMQFWSFGYTRVTHTPILHVNKYELSFNNGLPHGLPLVNIPLEFIHVQPQDGTVQLVPAQGVTISGLVVSIYQGLGFHAFNSQAISTWPGAVIIEYTAGFEKGRLPALLAGLIANIAAYKFLSSLGPVLFPYNSTSIGIDGTSQSVGTLGPAFLQARLADLEKMISQEMEAAKGYYEKRFLIDYL